ncbi:MAG: hypothetical protein ACI8PT_004863, partial [Gammaproteobacteria bacterium]
MVLACYAEVLELCRGNSSPIQVILRSALRASTTLVSATSTQ